MYRNLTSQAHSSTMNRNLGSRATDEEALSSVAGAEKQQLPVFTKQQLRYRLPRRRRIHMSPLFIMSNTAAADLSHSAAEATDEEVSCNSSVASVSNHKAPPLPAANFRYESPRLVTRSNYRNDISKFDEPLKVWENPCVESCSGANDVRELFKLKSANVEESEAEGGGGEVSKSELCRSTFSLAACDEFTLLGLVDVEGEESYRMLMKRERRQVYLRDYAEEYCNTTDYGHIVIQQRLHIEQATTNKFQMETMFLGVSFLDSFLAKGYFKNIRHLQIAGIPCLALTPKAEEKQTYHLGDDNHGEDDEVNVGPGEEVNVGPGEEVNVGPGEEVNVGPGDEGDEGGDDSDSEDQQYVCAHCSTYRRVTVFSIVEPYFSDLYRTFYFEVMSNVNEGDPSIVRGVCSAVLTCTGCREEVGSHVLWLEDQDEDEEEVEDEVAMEVEDEVEVEDDEVERREDIYCVYRGCLMVHQNGEFTHYW